jgi:hypothetical protein
LEPGAKPSGKRVDFQNVLARSIEQGLRNVLGESGAQVVLSLHSLESLSSDSERFHRAITAIFLDSGAAILEREIARLLLENIGNEPDREGWWLRVWQMGGSSKGQASGRPSEKEKRILQQFLALASIPHDHPTDSEQVEERDDGSLEQTAAKFAYAFKKGS